MPSFNFNILKSTITVKYFIRQTELLTILGIRFWSFWGSDSVLWSARHAFGTHFLARFPPLPYQHPYPLIYLHFSADRVLTFLQGPLNLSILIYYIKLFQVIVRLYVESFYKFLNNPSFYFLALFLSL